jgi:hypothetical protein
MLRRSFGAPVLALALLGLAHSQEKSDDKQPAKLKGQLPPFYKKLGISEEQEQKIFKVRAENKKKLAELKAEIQRLQKKERADCEAVLTPQQLKLLMALRSGERLPLEKPKK